MILVSLLKVENAYIHREVAQAGHIVNIFSPASAEVFA